MTEFQLTATKPVPLRAPFPYFGGKSLVADRVWARFGDCENYVEPFFGSGSVLLARPEPWSGPETVNDACGFVANFWRAVQADPKAVAKWADNPVIECDLHARHFWLVNQSDEMTAKLEGDPDWFDAKIAGWWVWGACCWIGHGWCSGEGPWRSIGSRLERSSNAGRGVNRQLPHLGNAGRGVNRQLPHLGNAGRGIEPWFDALSARLRRVRVCSGDWSRVVTRSVTTLHPGITAVFLDPPYSAQACRESAIYRKESLTVADDAARWAIDHGADPNLRIALCGYEGEHAMPADWERLSWKAVGGYANQARNASQGKANRDRERIWFSPHCLKPSGN